MAPIGAGLKLTSAKLTPLPTLTPVRGSSEHGHGAGGIPPPPPLPPWLEARGLSPVPLTDPRMPEAHDSGWRRPEGARQLVAAHSVIDVPEKGPREVSVAGLVRV